jgi:hypothetical protein
MRAGFACDQTWCGNRIATVLLAVSLTVSLAPATAFAADCTIDGGKAMAAAKSAGFVFSFASGDKNGECDRDDSWFLASASQNQDVTCKAVLFDGRELSDPWLFKHIDLGGAAVTGLSGPKTGSKQLTVKFSVTSPPGQDSTVYVKHVVLTGPDCKDWKDAF